jgi:carbon-monoxide dehydrogenase medium subunit
VTAIQFPLPPKESAGRYIKLGRNRLSDLSIVGVTAYGYPDATCSSGYRFRLALASVAPVPLLVSQVEEILGKNQINPNAIQEAARLAAETCSPIDDVRGSGRYRKLMVQNLSAKALTDVWEKLNK